MNSNVKLGVIGCGKMASAILGGVFNNNFLQNENIYLFDVNKNASLLLSDKFGFVSCDSIKEVVEKCDTLFLAVKPFVVDDVLNEIKKYYRNNLILSILAGVKIKKYEDILLDSRVVRIMPNTPALVNSGASAICYSNNVNLDEIEFAFNLMKTCGEVIKTTEDKMDIITALSGSGPAFYFKIIEDFANAAVKLGLTYDEALLLSAQTALGSAKLLIESKVDVNTLIQNVTTPGGCTAVGNDVLNNSDISQIIDKTIDETAKKAKALG